MTSVGQCAICFSSLTTSQAYVITRCGHTFHHNCAKTWILQGKNCPSCRVKASVSDLVKLYFHERGADDSFAPDAAVSKKVSDLEAKLYHVNGKVQQLHAEKEGLIADKHALKKQVADLESKLASANGKVQQLSAEKNVLVSDKSNLKKQVKEQQKQVEKVEALMEVNKIMKDKLAHYQRMEENTMHTSAPAAKYPRYANASRLGTSNVDRRSPPFVLKKPKRSKDALSVFEAQIVHKCVIRESDGRIILIN